MRGKAGYLLTDSCIKKDGKDVYNSKILPRLRSPISGIDRVTPIASLPYPKAQNFRSGPGGQNSPFFLGVNLGVKKAIVISRD